jgi:hypothetical protein
MRGRYILLLVVVLLALVLVGATLTVWAGDPDSPGGPTSDAAKMYTLEDIYNRINVGTTAISTTFTEPSSGPGTGTMHTLNEIYDLVGERAPVPKTGQTTSYRTGDDGDLEKGVSWPSPRFTGNGTGVITDTLTGLMWAENANLDGTKTWNNAIDYCNGLSLGGYTDWRLPNVRELFSLIDFSQYNPALPSGHPFDNVQSSYYWSSTTYASGTSYAWGVHLGSGYVGSGGKASTGYVWPVRGGQ